MFNTCFYQKKILYNDSLTLIQVKSDINETLKNSITRVKKSINNRVKTIATIESTKNWSRNVSKILNKLNLTPSQYYYERKKLKKMTENGDCQSEISLRSSKNRISKEQKNFIQTFEENFTGRRKYENFKIEWNKRFDCKAVSKNTFYRYTQSEKGKLIDKINNTKLSIFS